MSHHQRNSNQQTDPRQVIQRDRTNHGTTIWHRSNDHDNSHRGKCTTRERALRHSSKRQDEKFSGQLLFSGVGATTCSDRQLSREARPQQQEHQREKNMSHNEHSVPQPPVNGGATQQVLALALAGGDGDSSVAIASLANLLVQNGLGANTNDEMLQKLQELGLQRLGKVGQHNSSALSSSVAHEGGAGFEYKVSRNSVESHAKIFGKNQKQDAKYNNNAQKEESKPQQLQKKWTESVKGSHGGSLGLLSPSKGGTLKTTGSVIVPCRARGMPMDHNFKSAYFVIPDEVKHGAELICSYPACRNGGVKFRYCSTCRVPVAKRNFRNRHDHTELMTPEILARDKAISHACPGFRETKQSQEGDLGPAHDESKGKNRLERSSILLAKERKKEIKGLHKPPLPIHFQSSSNQPKSIKQEQNYHYHPAGITQQVEEQREHQKKQNYHPQSNFAISQNCEGETRVALPSKTQSKSNGLKYHVASNKPSAVRRQVTPSLQVAWDALLGRRPDSENSDEMSAWLMKVLAISDVAEPLRVTDSSSSQNTINYSFCNARLNVETDSSSLTSGMSGDSRSDETSFSCSSDNRSPNSIAVDSRDTRESSSDLSTSNGSNKIHVIRTQTGLKRDQQQESLQQQQQGHLSKRMLCPNAGKSNSSKRQKISSNGV